MSEGNGALWRYLRELLPAGIHATRIENRIGAGFPDVHYIYRGVTGHLELKFLRKKKLPFGNDGLNPEQQVWIREAEWADGLTWIVAEVTPKIYFVPGRHYGNFNHTENLEAFSVLTLTKRKIIPADMTKFARLLENKL